MKRKGSSGPIGLEYLEMIKGSEGSELGVHPAEPFPEALFKLEGILDKLNRSDKLSDHDLQLYDLYRSQVRFEMRRNRSRLCYRLYAIINYALDEMEQKLMMGEELGLSPNQLRLMLQMFLDQTREEFGDKEPDTVIDQRKQTVNVIKFIRVQDEPSGKVIDGRAGNTG